MTLRTTVRPRRRVRALGLFWAGWAILIGAGNVAGLVDPTVAMHLTTHCAPSAHGGCAVRR